MTEPVTMEMDYLEPVEARLARYNKYTEDTGGRDSPAEHIYEELLEPPALPPQRDWKYTNPKLKESGTTRAGDKAHNRPSHLGADHVLLPSVNENYVNQQQEQKKLESKDCCRHRKCFIIVLVVFLFSAVTLTGFLFHMYADERGDRGVAFSVFWPEMTGDASPAMTRVHFNKTYLVYPSRDAFPLTTSEFVTPNAGIYMFSLSIFAGSDICSYRIENPFIPIVLGRSSGNRIDGDTIGREMVVKLPADAHMHILKSGFIHDHDYYFLNSWSGFSLSSALKPQPVVFSVARRTPWSRRGPVAFDMDLINKDMDRNLEAFVAPKDGIYYFSASVGTLGSKTVQAHIAVEGLPVADLFRNSTTHDGPEILSRVAMFPLKAGQTVTLELAQGTLYSSDVIRETSFMGFLYEPRRGRRQAWSLHDSRSYVGVGNYHLDPVPFRRVLVAEGVGVDVTSRVTINCSGIYYVHLNTGVLPNKKLLLQLTLNARIVASIWRFSASENGTGHDGFDTVGRAILLSLYPGDSLHLSAAGFANFGLGSTPNTLTSFTGFLLYPT